MPRVTLTDLLCKSLPPPATGRAEQFDEKVRGLALRVTSSGAKSWSLVYRHRGLPRRLTLGAYPAMGLVDARNRARVELGRIAKDGADPAGEKRADRQAAQAARDVAPAQDDTFGALSTVYLEEYAKPRKRSWRLDARVIDHDLMPAWGRLRVREITPEDVVAVCETIIGRGAPGQANRTFAVARKMFRFALTPKQRRRFGLAASPCEGIERPAAVHERDRVLNTDELRRFWQALEAEDVQTAALFRLYLLTAQRGGELKAMEWSELDLQTGWWTVPKEKAKNHLAHRVPLSAAALEIVRALYSESKGSRYVFPGGGVRGHRTSTTKAVSRIAATSEVVDFRPHDLRRTAASYMTGMGISRLVVGKVLNHAEPGVTRVYDRHSYDPEKQAALNSWGARLEAIVTGESTTAKVIPLRAS